MSVGIASSELRSLSSNSQVLSHGPPSPQSPILALARLELRAVQSSFSRNLQPYGNQYGLETFAKSNPEQSENFQHICCTARCAGCGQLARSDCAQVSQSDTSRTTARQSY